MNKLTKLCAVILVCILPMAARAVDLATVDRSIKKEPGYQTKISWLLSVGLRQGSRDAHLDSG